MKQKIDIKKQQDENFFEQGGKIWFYLTKIIKIVLKTRWLMNKVIHLDINYKKRKKSTKNHLVFTRWVIFTTRWERLVRSE